MVVTKHNGVTTMGISALRDGMGSGIIKIVLLGLLLLAVLGLALMNVSSLFKRSGANNINPVLARIGSKTITAQDLREAMAPLLKQAGINEKQAYQMGATQGILDQQVNSYLVTMAAKNMGISVSSDEVARWIVSKAPEGSNPKEVLAAAIRASGGDSQRIIDEVGGDISTQILGQALTSKLVSTPQDKMIISMFMHQNEKRNIAILEFPYRSDMKLEKAPDEALYALYAARKNIDFAIPEKRSFDIIEIKSQGQDDEEVNKTVEYADALDNALISGQSIDEITKDIPVSVSSIDFVDTQGEGDGAKVLSDKYGNQVGNLLDVGFSLKDGQASSVIELPDARFVVISLKETAPRSYKPFEEVKGELTKQWEEDQVHEITLRKAQEAVLELKSGEKSIGDLENKNSAGELKKVKGISANDPALPIPLTPQTLPEIFSTNLGENVIIQIPNGVAVAQVREISLPGSNEMTKEALMEVRAQLEEEISLETLSMYVRYLRKSKDVKIYTDRLERLYSNKEAAL